MSPRSTPPVNLPGYLLTTEIILRILLFGAALCLELIKPFERKIHPEEAWLYRNPTTNSYVSVKLLYALVALVPISCFIAVNYLLRTSRSDISAAHLGFTLSVGLTGFLTNLIKITVGRPRPDFFFRCFPSGRGDFSKPCDGHPEVILEGRKSFPSGHASMIFCAYTFLSLYLLAKLQALNSRAARLRTHRLILSTSPFIIAILVAISRTCDYHHHWQDVTVGSLLGIVIGYFCYRQQYPSVFDPEAHIPIAEYPVYDLSLKNDELCDLSVNYPQIKPNQKWI